MYGCGGLRSPANNILQAEARHLLVAAVTSSPAEPVMCKLQQGRGLTLCSACSTHAGSCHAELSEPHSRYAGAQFRLQPYASCLQVNGNSQRNVTHRPQPVQSGHAAQQQG